MKLISYNVYGGRLGKPLLEYIKQFSVDGDFFCFQEIFDSNVGFEEYKNVRLKLFKELQRLLPDFQGFFAPSSRGFIDMQRLEFEAWQGMAMFIRKSYKVRNVGSEFIFGDFETAISDDFTNEPKNLQFAEIEAGHETFLIGNFHGKWYPGDKLDTLERLEQSRKIINFLQKFDCVKILCGDFNLMPETKSIQMLETKLRNLIAEYKITNTRNEISWKKYGNRQSFADYVFVSPTVIVNDFQVPYNLFSDHLPMIVNFSL